MGVDALMMFSAPEPMDDDALRSVSDRLILATDPSWFFLIQGRHAISRWRADDCVTFEPEPAGFLHEVHVSDRYYGPGYERGDIWNYVAIATWLESNIPHSRVYYGDDHSDRMIAFDSEARQRFIDHWRGPNGQDYRRKMGAL